MGKRIMLAIVGMGLGAFAGLVADVLGAGNIALLAGGAIGAIVPQFILGAPGK